MMVSARIHIRLSAAASSDGAISCTIGGGYYMARYDSPTRKPKETSCEDVPDIIAHHPYNADRTVIADPGGLWRRPRDNGADASAAYCGGQHTRWGAAYHGANDRAYHGATDNCAYHGADEPT